MNVKAGWRFQPTPLKKLVSWDDEIPNIYGNIIQLFQTTTQIQLVGYLVPTTISNGQINYFWPFSSSQTVNVYQRL